MAIGSGEFTHIDEDSTEDVAEMLYPRRRCCFCIPYRSSAVGLNWWRRMRTTETNPGGWWARGVGVLMKIREWSEIAAGPKWKTFIRRFNRSKSGKHVNFQYDPLSYSLNFDQSHNLADEEYGSRNFSSRYAAVPVSSMDLGKEVVAFA